MATLKKKMKLRNLGLWSLYWGVRPSMWLAAWMLVDFSKLTHFHMIMRNGGRVINASNWEMAKDFWYLSLWPMALPLVAIWLLDVFVVATWFKSNVVKVASDSI